MKVVGNLCTDCSLSPHHTFHKGVVLDCFVRYGVDVFFIGMAIS